MPTYKKHFIPLESDPLVFTDLAHGLGLSKDLSFQDVLSLDDPDLVAFVPRPILALILAFPASGTGTYEAQTAQEEASLLEYEGTGEAEGVIWYKQTIHNACGLYGLLHAVSNRPARDFIGRSFSRIFTRGIVFVPLTIDLEPKSALATLLQQCMSLPPKGRAEALEASLELEEAHRKAALQGQSNVPEDATAEVDYHYVCFVNTNGHVYELDGDKQGPINKGSIPVEEDVLGEQGLRIIREFILQGSGQNQNFSLMALVRN